MNTTACLEIITVDHQQKPIHLETPAHFTIVSSITFSLFCLLLGIGFISAKITLALGFALPVSQDFLLVGGFAVLMLLAITIVNAAMQDSLRKVIAYGAFAALLSGAMFTFT